MDSKFSWSLTSQSIPAGVDLDEPVMVEVRGVLPNVLVGWTVGWSASSWSARRLLTFEQHRGLLRRLALQHQLDWDQASLLDCAPVPTSTTRHFGQQLLTALAVGLDVRGGSGIVLYVTRDALRAEVLFEVGSLSKDDERPVAWLTVSDEHFYE